MRMKLKPYEDHGRFIAFSIRSLPSKAAEGQSEFIFVKLGDVLISNSDGVREICIA
jgi:hypothetical protein